MGLYARTFVSVQPACNPSGQAKAAVSREMTKWSMTECKTTLASDLNPA